VEVADAHEGSFERGGTAHFTGDVRVQRGLSTPDGTGMIVVHFSAGARTHWHAHPGGQLLFGLSGLGRVRSRDGRTRMLAPGDIVDAPPGEWHYHGGGPDSPMAHVAVNIGGAPEWGDPVTDDEDDDEDGGDR
jgi:quercetin dioxygenase-like cupin family protein